MASIIRIKRSSVAGNPNTLAAGELAYSALTDNGSNGGDRLYIGIGTETAGNAANHFVIGGKYFTDMLDHTRGTLTANSAIITDANSKIDNLKVDNLELNSNTLSSTDANGNINITPNGTGSIVLDGQNWPQADGTVNQYLKTNGSGQLAWAAIPSGSFTLAGDTGTDTFTTGETMTFTGSDPIDTSVSDNTITFSIKDATTTTKGAASFADANFTVSSGAVSTKSITLGTSTLTNGSTTTSLAGLQQLDVDNIRVDGNTISSTDTDGHINIVPNGTGDVKLTADTTVVGDANANAAITTNGTGNLTLSTNEGTNSGTIVIVNGVNGDIGIIPNGDGKVNLSTHIVNVGDLNTNATITTYGTGDLILNTNGGTNSGKITILDGANANIEIEPNGTGDVKLVADTTIVGDLNADAIITTNGTGDLTLSTNSSTNSGTIKIEDGIDNHIILTPAGTGDVKLVADTTVIGDANANATITTNGTGDLTLSTNSGVNSGTITIPDGVDTDISIDPNGTGSITVNSARIINLADPVNPQDAATKNYVDDVAQGLSVKPAVRVATTANLTATYDNGTNGVGSTLTLAASATLTIDGVSLTALYTGILVKNQTNAFENGRYFISQVGNISTPWILTRCPKCDEASEIPSMYIFVQEGTANAATGWVAVVEDFNAFDVGIDDIVFYQFAGAGNYLAGDALTFGLDGRTFNVVVAASGGIEIVSDALQLKSTVAGSGLTYNAGVISIGGTTNRITVSDDAIDIASTYVGQNTITTLGTIGTGTWQGTIIDPTYGGTGVNNGTKTITLGGNLTTSGAFATTLTVTDATNVTLPTTGTLATLAGTETFTNKTLTSPTITGGSINNTSIGATTASTGRFTTVTITGTDASSSTTTGALVVAGGLGVGEDIYVAQDIIGAGAGTSDLDGFNIDGGTY